MKYVIAFCTAAMLSACSSGSSPSTSTQGTTPQMGAPTPTSADNTTFGSLLNNVRATNGANAVTFDSRLASAAQKHADDMRSNGFFSHTGSDNSTVGDRATAAGYTWRNIAENIAKGQQSESEAMTAWTNSPGHHANNINPVFQDFALSKAGSGSDTYWVLVLGRHQ